MTKVVVWGTAGHARVVADIVQQAGDLELVGFLDDVHPERAGTIFCGAPVLGGRERLAELGRAGVSIILGFGDNLARRRIGAGLAAAGFELPRAIHPRSVVAADARLGAGAVLCAGAVVNPNATLGAHVIVNTGATVDHDCRLGDAVHVSPGAHLAGGVVVGAEAWVGIGAVVVDGVTIGERTTVGAGAVVTRDLPPGVVAYGVPARVVRGAG